MDVFALKPARIGTDSRQNLVRQVNPSLSGAYGVSCRARAERVRATPEVPAIRPRGTSPQRVHRSQGRLGATGFGWVCRRAAPYRTGPTCARLAAARAGLPSGDVLIGKEALAGQPAQAARHRQRAQQRRSSIALLPALLVQAVEHAQHVVETDLVAPAQDPARVVQPVDHPRIDVLGAAYALAQGERRLVDHLADDPAQH